MNKYMKKIEQAGKLRTMASQNLSEYYEFVRKLCPGDPDTELDLFVKKCGNTILPEFAKLVCIDLSDARRRMLGIEMAKLEAFNAGTWSSNGFKTFNIVLNMGFMVFLHKIIKIFSFMLDFPDEKHVRPITSPDKIKIMTAASKPLIETFWSGDKFRTSSVLLKDLSSIQIDVCADLLASAEMFAIGHEFGHVVIKMKPQNSALDVAHAFLRQIRKTVIDSWANEIASDIMGMNFIVPLCNQRFSIPPQISFAGCEMVFIIENVLASYRAKVHNRPVKYETHPPPQLRLQILRKVRDFFSKNSWQSNSCDLGYTMEQLATLIIKEA